MEGQGSGILRPCNRPYSSPRKGRKMTEASRLVISEKVLLVFNDTENEPSLVKIPLSEFRRLVSPFGRHRVTDT